MIIKTTTDPTTAIGSYKKIQYEPNVYFCYAVAKDGKHIVKAIIHVINDGWIVDAEKDVIVLIPHTLPALEKPSPLYDTMVLAYGKRAQHTGPLIKGETYSGHSVLSSTPSARTWKEMRKLEYRIEESKIEESLEQLKRLN